MGVAIVDPDDDSIVQLGDTEAEVFDDGTAGGFTDLTVLTITDAVGDTIEAYLSLERDRLRWQRGDRSSTFLQE